MTNEEVIEVLEAYKKNACLQHDKDALQGAIDKVRGKAYETNAEWCISNNVKFSDLRYEYLYKGHYRIYWVDDRNHMIEFYDYEGDEESVLLSWLDDHCHLIEDFVFSEETNAEWLISKGIKFSDVRMNLRQSRYGGGYYAECKSTNEKLGQIVNVTTPDGRQLDAHGAYIAWLDQNHEDYKEPEELLTGEERGYLKNVIKPFRDKVKFIEKITDRETNIENDIDYWISVDLGEDDMRFPMFKKSSGMYFGMMADRPYSLQELGL